MENTKHTPGPWKIQPHTTVDKEFTVGPAIMDYDDVDHDQQDANARLISAAPNQHEAHYINLGDLEMLRMAIAAGDPKKELLLRTDDMIKRTRAAIAKATA